MSYDIADVFSNFFNLYIYCFGELSESNYVVLKNYSTQQVRQKYKILDNDISPIHLVRCFNRSLGKCIVTSDHLSSLNSNLSVIPPDGADLLAADAIRA